MSNFAFIDSQNLNLGIKNQGWILDFARFRVYLGDKFNVSRAFLFLGYVDRYQDLYTSLQEAGFILIFKPTLKLPTGKIKGNVDAELVLHTMIEFNNFDKAIITTGDGDFHCLVNYLIKKDKLLKLIIPDKGNYSALLRKFRKYIMFMDGLKNKLEYKKDR